MNKTQFSSKEVSQDRHARKNPSADLDQEPMKIGFSEISKRRFAHEEESTQYPISDLILDDFTMNKNSQNTDNLPNRKAKDRNSRVNTSLRSNDDDSREKLNNSRKLINEAAASENLSDNELPRIIKRICDQASYLLSQGNAKASKDILHKAEALMEKYNSSSSIADFELLFLVFNNMAVACYKLSLLEEAQLYTESSLMNFEYLKKIRKPNRQFNFSLLGDQTEYVLHRKKKMLAKKYKCKTHMQTCIILSELYKHTEALDHAKIAAKIASNIIVDTLILCYYFIFKGRKPAARKSIDFYGNGQKVKKINTNDGHSFDEDSQHTKQTAGDTTFDFYWPENGSSSENASKDTSFYRAQLQDANQSDGSKFITDNKCYKLIPILEEIVQRVKMQRFFSTKSKRDRLLAYYRLYFCEEKWDPPDLNYLYGFLRDDHWLNTTNLLTILQLSAVESSKINFESPTLDDELELDSIIEKILILVTSFYSISTETRFIKELDVKESPTQKLNSLKLSESENWLSKSIELGYLFIPHSTPLIGQIFSVYTKLHSLSNQIILEDEEMYHELKYLKPLRGGSRTNKFIPVIRCKNNEEIITDLFNPQGPFLHEKPVLELELNQTKQDIPAYTLSLQEQIASRLRQKQVDVQEGQYRSNSSGHEPQHQPTSATDQLKQSGVNSQLAKVYLNIRPNSRGAKPRSNIQSAEPQLLNFQPPTSELSNNTDNIIPTPPPESNTTNKKVNNFFSSGPHFFQQGPKKSSVDNPGMRVHSEEAPGQDLDSIEKVERSLIHVKRPSSQHNQSSKRAVRQPSPVFPAEIRRDHKSKPANFHKVLDNSLVSRERERPSSGTKYRQGTIENPRKSFGDASTLIKASNADEIIRKRVQATPASLNVERVAPKSRVESFPQKFDININNNINFFINNDQGGDLDYQLAGSIAHKSKENQHSIKKPIKFEEIQRAALNTSMQGAKKMKPRPPEQRRVETDPDQYQPNTKNVAQYSTGFINKITGRRGKSTETDEKAAPEPRVNKSVPKRNNLSYSRALDADRSDIIVRNDIEQLLIKITRENSNSVERKTRKVASPKRKPLSELEKILRVSKAKSPIIREDAVRPPSRVGEKAQGQSTHQPYLNTISMLNSSLNQGQSKGLNSILPRDQLSKNISRIRAKYHQDSFDNGADNLNSSSHNINTTGTDGGLFFDHLRANSKMFRTYDKS